jgi:hypothetical protein
MSWASHEVLNLTSSLKVIARQLNKLVEVEDEVKGIGVQMKVILG